MTPLFRLGLSLLCLCLILPAASAEPGAPPFDMQAIIEAPLEPETLKREVRDGIVIEHVTFNGDRDRDGAILRLSGILAYPEGGSDLPALLWCQGGMGDAQPFFPTLFARKGYACLHITLSKKVWNAHGKFDAADPTNGNLVRLAVEQMRGVTYIANRPEVNADRIGVGGASYGGLFATFVAGADPRIKAGMSFFGAGNHHLGTNLPQFIKLANQEEVEIFSRTGDGAAYLRQREIPFIWGLPTNDNWFFFPAVVETFRQKPGEKRIAILPHWIHGFPPELDQQLFDWFDIYLKGTRDPYLAPGTMTLAREGDTLVAEWSWNGKPAARRADLIVSYGRSLPWHGWRHRYYHTIPARIDGQRARAEIPIPDPDLPILVFGNLYDVNDVLVSTDPVEATPRAMGIAAATGFPVTNGSPRGAFEPEDTHILAGTAQAFGRVDPSTAHSGSQSIAIDPPAEGAKPKTGRPEARLILFNVYERDHRLRLWLKAERPMTVNIAVRAQAPTHWDAPAVKAILASMPDASPIPAAESIPAFTLAAELSAEWREFTVDVPYTGVAVEGYELHVDRAPGEAGTYWIDDVSFEALWHGARPAPLLLADGGNANLPIVIAPDASEAIKATAAELATFLQRISGAPFTVQTGTAATGITLGTLAQFPDPALAEPLAIRNFYDGIEAFAIRTDADRIRLIANTDVGLSHAVHRFLELLGCRWFFMTDTWEVVPEARTLTFAHNEESRPDIWSRIIWFDRLAQRMEPGDPEARPLFNRWATRNRMNQSLQVTISHAWHKIPKVMAADFEGHPEYFALVEGERQGPQFCVTNPGLQATIIAYARRELAAKPTLDMVSLDPADTSGWCTCEACAALGHHSVQPFHLANIAARALQASHPGKYVGILAYSWYSMPPPFELEANVHVQLTRGLNAGRYTADELYAMWTERKGSLGIYEYYSYWHMDRNLLPGTWIVDLHANAERIRDYARKGIVDVNAQASDNWGIHGLAYYVANRLMWDVDADVDALRDDFLSKAFGPAAEPMGRYYARVSQSPGPIPGMGLIRQAIDDVEEASRLAAGKPAILARIDDIKKLLIYSYLGEKTDAPASSYVGIKMAEGIDWEPRRQIFLDWFTWAYRMRNSHMIAWLTYRSTVGNPISKQYGDDWFWRNTVKSKAPNPWRDETPITTEELDQRLADIKAELGPLPDLAAPPEAATFALARFEAGAGVETVLPVSGQATWLLASTEGEPLRFVIETKPTVIKLGEGVAGVEQPREIVLEIPDARYTLTAADGTVVDSGQLPLGINNLELKVPAPGIYRFTCKRGGAGWIAHLGKELPHALLLSPGQDSLDIVDMPGGDAMGVLPVWFYVPGDITEIVLQAYQCGVVTIRSPSGDIALQGVSDGRFLRIPVPEGQAGRCWQLDLTEEMRRGRLQFLNLPTVLSFTPTAAFVPAAAATAIGK